MTLINLLVWAIMSTNQGAAMRAFCQFILTLINLPVWAIMQENKEKYEKTFIMLPCAASASARRTRSWVTIRLPP